MTSFRAYRTVLIDELLATEPIHTGSWQRIDTSSSPAHATYELTDEVIRFKVTPSLSELQTEVQPDLPWAELHFQERIGGVPLNPPPSHEIWPYAVKGNGRHLDGGKFSHTYPERFWPKRANTECPSPEECMGTCGEYGLGHRDRWGVRFRYGDLQDVIDLLKRERLTRQAFLPIWFPEDTGVTDNQRVPCTLGYHFLVRGHPLTRDNFLSMRYYMRSCDIYRHFTNDVYMACRLMQHVVQELNEDMTKLPVRLGELKMYISSLHAFVGDREKLEAMR